MSDTADNGAAASPSKKPKLSRLTSVEVAKRMRNSKGDRAEGFGDKPDDSEMDVWMSKFADMCDKEFENHLESEKHQTKTTEFGFLDVGPYVNSAIEAIVEDSFTQCFESPKRSLNTTFYLFPLYFLGVIIRYGVLFPLRVLIVLGGMIMFAGMFAIGTLCTGERRKSIHMTATNWLARAYLWSWCAVIHEHGIIPPREKGQIYVANHSSVIDVVILLQAQAYSLTGQKHTGAIGFFQNHVLGAMGNLWFDRMEGRDRKLVAERIKQHLADMSKPPLLVFPEGTCVNNEYVVMFKRGAFELGTSVVPVAIKYNKIFVNGYWNSRKASFIEHLVRLMTSWAVVCDVYYLEPQYRRKGESSTAFASRVKEMIADTAGLKAVPWDGYLKYFKPRDQYTDARCKTFAKMLTRRFGSMTDVAEDDKNDDSEDSGLRQRKPATNE